MSSTPKVGTAVETPEGVVGVVRSAPRNSGRNGRTVQVEYLPDFQHLATKPVSLRANQLTSVRVCACSHLGYVNAAGDIRTTGCDFSREPGPNSQFLAGHDSKAKSLLINAWNEGAELLMGYGHPALAARGHGFAWQVQAAVRPEARAARNAKAIA